MAENSTEVGVLELQIKDKSAESAKGLDKLVGALTAVKHVVEGLDLSPLANAITNLHSKIIETKGASTMVKQLGTMFNAIDKFSKLKTGAFTTAITELGNLKTTLSGGINFGNASSELNGIREALNGEWSGENSETAVSSLKNIKDAANELSNEKTSTKINNVANAIKKYNEAVNEMKSTATQAVGSTVQTANKGVDYIKESGVDYASAMRDYSDIIENTKLTFKEPVAGGDAGSTGGWRDTMNGLLQINEAVQAFDPTASQNLQTLAAVLKDLNNYADGEKLKSFAEGLRNIANAASKGGNSYHTLTYLGNAMGLVNAASIGFRLPDFTKLENLARSLQENYNASESLKQIAKAMEALKSAGHGFTMPDMKGLSKVMAAMNGDGAGKNVTVGDTIRETAESASIGTEELEKTVEVLSDVKEVIDEVATDGNSQLSIPQMDTSNISVDTIEQAGSAVEDIKETTTAIIVYNDNLKNQWSSIVQVMAEAKSAADEIKDSVQETTNSLREQLEINESQQRANEEANAVWEWMDEKKKQRDELAQKKEAEQTALDTSYIRNLIETASEADLLAMKIDSLKDRIIELSESGKLTGQNLYDMVMRVRKLDEKLKEMNANEALSKTQEITGEGKHVKHFSLEETNEIVNNLTQLDLLKAQLRDAQEQYNEFVNTLGQDDAKTIKAGLNVSNLQEKIDKLTEAEKENEEVVRSLSEYQVPIDEEELIRAADNFMNMNDKASQLTMQIDALKQKLGNGILNGTMDDNQIARTAQQIENLQERLEELKESEEEASSGSFSLRNSFDRMKQGILAMFPGLKTLRNQFISIARRMAIRGVIKQFTSGLSEGLENVYHYSEAINGSFAKSMDSASTSLLQMKNSLGAALTPAIEALIPVMQTVVNWVITGINYVNQFLALLNGQKTWTRALPYTTKAFGDQDKAAKKASKSMKDLLADWDELNIIQSQNGGGGGGNKDSKDYLTMFEEVDEFNEKVKGIVGWIEDHMETVKKLALAIGVGILGWKLSKAFSGALGKLGSYIMDGAIIAVGLTFTAAGAYDAGLNGEWDNTSLLETVGGSLMSTIGGALVGYKLGGPWGALIGGATGLIASIAVAFEAYQEGDRLRIKKSKWGKLHLTEEQIDELVDRQFTAQVKAQLEIVDANIQNRRSAKAHLNEELARFASDLDVVKFTLSADNSNESIKQALTSAENVITELKGYLKNSREGLTLQFTKFTYKNDNGEDITADLYEQVLGGNLAIEKLATEFGGNIAKALSESYSGTLSEETKKMALDTMEAVNEIFGKADRQRQQRNLLAETNDDVYDLETAEGVIAKQKERLKEYQDTYMEETKQDIEDANYALDVLTNMKEYFERKGDKDRAAELDDYIEGYKTQIENLEDQLAEMKSGEFWEKDETYQNVLETMRNGWKNMLSVQFGEQIAKWIGGNPDAENPFKNNSTLRTILSAMDLDLIDLLTQEQLDAAIANQKILNNGDIGDVIKSLMSTGVDWGNFDPMKFAEQLIEYATTGHVEEIDEKKNKITEIVADNLGMEASEINVDTNNVKLAANGFEFGKEVTDKAKEWIDNVINQRKENNDVDINDLLEEKYTSQPQTVVETHDNEWWKDGDSSLGGWDRETSDPMDRVLNESNLTNDIPETVVKEAENIFDGLMDPIEQRVKEKIGEYELNPPTETDRRNVWSAPDVFDSNPVIPTNDPFGRQPSGWDDSENQMTPEQMQSSTEIGVRNGNEPLEVVMQNILTWVTRICNKDFTVNVNPNSKWGAFNRQSNDAYDRVIG